MTTDEQFRAEYDENGNRVGAPRAERLPPANLVQRSVPVGEVPDEAWHVKRDPATGEPVADGEGDPHRSHVVWQLRAAAGAPQGEDDWRIVNAGRIDERDLGRKRPTGRFRRRETHYQLQWVPEGGGYTIDGPTLALSGAHAAPRRAGTLEAG